MRHPLVAAFVLFLVGTPAISSAETLSLSPETLKIFITNPSAFTVMLSEPAPTDTFVPATSSDASVAFPEGGGAVISAGQTTGTLMMSPLSLGTTQVTVTLGTLTATARAVVVSGLALTPDPLAIQTNSTANMTVTISAPAGPEGSDIQLSSAGLVTVPATVTIASGRTSAMFSVAAGNTAGTTQLSAFGNGGGDVATVVVGAGATRALTLNPDPLSLLTNSTAAMSISLSEPSPAGGLSVSLSSSGVVLVPGTIQVPAQTSAATFQVSAGVTAGSDQVVATASGYTGDAANVVVTANFDELACRTRTRDAAEAGRAYAKAANEVARACLTRDARCDLAVHAADAAYAQVAAAQSALLAACQ